LGDEINTVRSHHVEGGVGEVNDAGYSEDKGEPNGEKGVYTPTDKTAHDDVDKEIHMDSNSNHQIPSSNNQIMTKSPCLPAPVPTEGGRQE
jgi:hypothetical protein